MTDRSFNVLSATAVELQDMMTLGTLTSVEVLERYMDQIEKHNHAGLKLNALLSVAPRENVLAQAKALDDERKHGITRGPLHGLPVVVKDCIMTHPSLGMKTTAGAYAFANAEPKKTAAVLQQCINAGMVILGKATLTEFCGHRASEFDPGYSAYGGQTISAYDPRTPEQRKKSTSSIMQESACGGSSSGSAVAVSAGSSPLSIGTETGGSLVYPAGKNGLYAIKPSKGSVSSDGSFRISSSFDCIGAMAKTPADLALLCETMLIPAARNQLPAVGYQHFMTKSWDGVKAAFLDLKWADPPQEKWQSPGVKSKFEDVASTINELGGKAVYPVRLPEPNILNHEGQYLHQIAFFEFPAVFEEFCEQFEKTAVHNLGQLIKFNEENKDLAMPQPSPDQQPLIDSLNSPLSGQQAEEAYVAVKSLARAEMDKLMAEHDVELLVSNSDSGIVGFAATAGYPTSSIPLGIFEATGQPYGMFVIAKAGREDLIFRFMSAYEATFDKLPSPPLLRD
ncbi:hypothetical protein BP5796_11385 [Coleophoma crateriformis]|uniref:Amidase domain-containing protein n=1 Tax=Coleophoma crateriformis TaxID=565419 RepID=A0A3D8QI19_9HELO|nr:hypothetical protein BP5796_11385 [Coleophoma crateriformis]